MKITVGITTHNRFDFIKQQIEKNYCGLSGGLVDEIVIQDDFSDDYNLLKPLETDIIKIFQNDKHLFPMLTRVELLKNCKNDWVILLDSDNFLDENSFKVISQLNLEENTIYAPGFARPGFNYTEEFGDKWINFKEISEQVQSGGKAGPLLNTGNYLVNKNIYLKISKQINNRFVVCPYEVSYFNFLWLKNGKKIFVVKDFHYDHRVVANEGFWWTTHSQHEDLYNEIKQMYLAEPFLNSYKDNDSLPFNADRD